VPFYDYYCANCKKEIEVKHGMLEDFKIDCEKCKIPMKRKFMVTSAIIIGESFKDGRSREPAYVGKKLEEFKEHPERDPYRKQRET
jgi:putative FmdB family regulatory protein